MRARPAATPAHRQPMASVSAGMPHPYNVAVGGTDFGDTYDGTNSTYWNRTNGTNYGSAILHSRDSLERFLREQQLFATSLVYYIPSAEGLCSSTPRRNDGLVVVAGSGGPQQLRNRKAVLRRGRGNMQRLRQAFLADGSPVFRAMACGTSRMFRCSPRTESGDTTMSSATPIGGTAERLARERPARWDGSRRHRSPRRSWPASKR